MLQAILQPNSSFSHYNVAEMTFAEWLNVNRKKAGLTQAEVAKRSGLSFSYISTLERDQPHSLTGRKIAPTRAKVTAIAKAVGGDINDALTASGFTSLEPSPLNAEISRRVALLEKEVLEGEQEEVIQEIDVAFNMIKARLEARRTRN